ncbi:cytochrome c oxidase subunit II [Sphaerospermopsis aphanizomenoides BCCUSP55]|uniref:cytochrome c oxidase subunit II n=1 Tax=Sphaerospermopsis aphanizomenoides TaxID=459663 RepID=UPI000A6F6603|nr:cytochrome c oxidase subunit II [Sphaerospermopsis aphanizomenoides]MBK1987455.1 cytochrome c oxidase subunit II [Sphaerospermopsis aphanizomenoides BCCUSP55]
MKIPSSIWTLLIGIVLTLVSLWYGQNHGLLPTAASDEAVLIDGLFSAMLTVSMGIFLIVEGVLIYSIFKYRRRAGDNEDGPPIEGNVPLEILWTAIPAIIVIGISVYSFDVYNQIGGLNPHGGHEAPMMQEAMKQQGTAIAATLSDTPSNKAQNLLSQADQAAPNNAPQLVIDVSALQYAWIFTYPDTGVTTGELHLPIGKEIQMNMTANDVIHAFWVPEFRLKQDVIPGRQTEVRITPRKEGSYTLICAELCGPYHGAMQTQVVVESQAAFDSWMQEQLVASKDTLNQAVAMNPADMPPDEFLAPYTQNMGIHPEMLHQVHH